ncbi:hypothetical protein TKK_0004903 [Trichogramma kaykai]|uniref:Gustatory receptor n=1 Tax=Trichogramma kaykai TaxID=54128 RepID=A0ABD2XK29_9HYME
MSAFLLRLHYFFKIFGLSTMSVKKLSKFNRYRFETSRKDLAYNVALILGFLLIGSYYTRVVWLMDYEGRSMFEKTCEVFDIVFAFSVSITLYVLYCARQKRIVRLADRFYALGRSLAGNSDELSKAIARRTRRTFVTYLILYAIFTISAQPVAINGYYLDHAVIAGLTLDFILLTVILQYCLVLICLVEMFAMVNRHLEGISKRSSHKSYIEPRFKSSSNFLTFELYKSQDSQFSYQRSQYFSLCDLSQDLSDFFGLPMLMVVSFIFFLIIFAIYYPARTVINQVKIMGYTTLSSYCQTWFGFFATGYLLVVLTNSTARIGKEKERTAEIIIKWSAIVDNAATEKQLDQFYKYLQSKNVQFSVFGLFKLDQSLLLSIVSSTTTYLVIILQFRETK